MLLKTATVGMRADPRYRSAFTSENINGVFIPSTLVVAGAFLVKPEWVPYVVAVTAILAGLKLMSGSSTFNFLLGDLPRD